jgi:hypothetical protein
MPVEQDRIAPDAYETATELVIRIELPEAAAVDLEQLTAALHDRVLEIRMPRQERAEETGRKPLVGFHPDAPPS